MSTFHVGQKVVCIKVPGAWGNHGYGNELVPAKSRIYTVREVLSPDSKTDCILLREIVNLPADYAFGVMEFCFKSTNFRPLAYPSQSLEHDMAKFRGVPARVPEESA